MSALNRFGDEQEQLEEQAVAWVVRLTSGDATDSEQRAAEAWRHLSPAHDQAFRKVQRLWIGVEPLKNQLSVAEEQATFGSPTVRVLSAERSNNRLSGRHLRIRWGAIAASIGALAVMLTLANGTLPLLWADARTGTGEQLTLPLNDGSQIFLNTQAAVSVHYSGDIRRVDLLAGEAAFQVAKDAARPFVVHTRDGQVRAVGTEFLVYKTPEAVVVTVTEGVVDVSAPGAHTDSPTRVHAGQRVRYSASGVSQVEPVDIHAVTAWQRGKLIFEATPLTAVVEEINRYRPGRVVLLNETLARHPVSGVFDLDRLNTAVTTIEQTLPVTTVRLTSRFVLFR
ncbi:MAG: FecR family protein [Nitrospiraceae bacterium]